MKFSNKKFALSQIVKIIYEWTDLTQKEFAKVLGRSQRQIQGYETGTTTYNIKALEKIIKN